ncbi:hypothetical protein M569_15929 [Genlisea aurea]|uniref:Malectin-like domain-containing protein n=1 Tax=Genlisea aurea TaxID=192259 RepID=S8D887_9LAMI|nr:hypothetical protein M569_15929 [Genlisea aurea]
MTVVFLCVFLVFRPVVCGGGGGGEISGRQELDALLQDYAFRALVRPRTGTVYDGSPPADLAGIQVSALRLRSGSLWRRGFSDYKEFRIPVNVEVHPYVERLVFVYQNLGNWSSLYYNLSGYTMLSPILGLLAYNGSNISSEGLQNLRIRASGSPISVSFAGLPSVFDRPSTRCAYFSLNGSVEFSVVVNASTCLTDNQGHFSIVVSESSPVVPPRPSTRPPRSGRGGDREGEWTLVGSLIGGVALVAASAVAISYLVACRKRKELRRMEAAAEVGVPLSMTSVGSTRAPVALETRTRPLIENEFVP